MKHAFISIFGQNDPVTPSGPCIRYGQNLICETPRRYLYPLRWGNLCSKHFVWIPNNKFWAMDAPGKWPILYLGDTL